MPWVTGSGERPGDGEYALCCERCIHLSTGESMLRLERVLVLALLIVNPVGCTSADPEVGVLSRAVATAAVTGWSAAAPLPEPRTEVSVTTDGRRIYLAGGFAAGSDPGVRATTPRTLWVYDPGVDRWSTMGEIPEGLHHAGFVHLDGKLYLVGGFSGTSFSPTAAVRVLDLATGSWSDAAPLPTPRGAMAVVILDGRIHAIGGNATGPEAVHDHAGASIAADNSVAVHEVFDPRSNRWSRLAPMPTARNHHAGAVVDGRIHVLGGRVDRNFELTVHEVYDPGSDRWEPAAPLPTGRSGIAATVRDQRLYVFGGETVTPGPRTFADAERYDAPSGRWQRLPPMPRARHGLGAATIGDRIHLISGGPTAGFSFGTDHDLLAHVPD
jgi:N-acetylneuraminic acid mutarotase